MHSGQVLSIVYSSHTQTLLDEMALSFLIERVAVVKVRIPVGFLLSFFCLSRANTSEPPSTRSAKVSIAVLLHILPGAGTCVFYTKLSFSPHSTDLFIIHKTRGQVTHLKCRQHCWSETGWISTAVPFQRPYAHTEHMHCGGSTLDIILTSCDLCKTSF